MAKPMTHTQFIDLCKEWGIPTEDNSRGGTKWYDHNREGHGAWGPVNGIGNHHTGGADNKSGADVLWNGYGALPGPLCHAGIRQNGVLLLNGWGRVNHFGLGDDDTLDHVIEEDYTGTLIPNEANTDGNARFYGFEWMYDGTKDPAIAYPAMWQTAVRINAAICTFHGWGKKSAIGHKEWQPGKPDPGKVNMVVFRDHVAQAISEGPKRKPPIKSYTVKSGDTLGKIALAQLGDPTRWDEIVAKNAAKIVVLKPGTILTLPSK